MSQDSRINSKSNDDLLPEKSGEDVRASQPDSLAANQKWLELETATQLSNRTNTNYAADASPLTVDEADEAVAGVPASPSTDENSAPATPVATTNGKKARNPKSFWREVLETVILTIVIFFIVKSTVQHFRILGSSMEPNFHTEQQLLVNKAAYFHFDINPWLRLIPGVNVEGSNIIWPFGGPKRGDVVIFEYPKDPTQDYIKRVIGLPGDKVEVRNGTVYVNDTALNEPYLREKPLANYPPTVVPTNNLFVMGDNRNGSSDSRSWGPLPFDRIIGKAMFVYWPFKNGWGIVPEIKYDGIPPAATPAP